VTSNGQLQSGNPCAAARERGNAVNRRRRADQMRRHRREEDLFLDVMAAPPG
jgi:hypothetical protein